MTMRQTMDTLKPTQVGPLEVILVLKLFMKGILSRYQMVIHWKLLVQYSVLA